ncbi:MAG: hypothetical protein GY795_44490 [Desulfobacterales bacterium]|nr:hypothetical protein [Desulfobacterales bacterium]
MKIFTVLTRIINLVFWIFMPAITAIILSVYWIKVAEPQLRADAKNNAGIWAQSNEFRITNALNSFTPDSPESVKRIRQALDTICLFEERKTGIRFILGVKLEMDYEVINARQGELDITAGETSCDECFAADIPIYFTDTKELIGYATFYYNGEFFRRMKDDMKSRLLKLSGIFLACYIIAWGILTVRIGIAENEIQKQRAEELDSKLCLNKLQI